MSSTMEWLKKVFEMVPDYDSSDKLDKQSLDKKMLNKKNKGV